MTRGLRRDRSNTGDAESFVQLENALSRITAAMQKDQRCRRYLWSRARRQNRLGGSGRHARIGSAKR